MNRKQRSDQRTEAKKGGLVLQGGGALGAYQAGVYEVLVANGHMPDWISGISIGAINEHWESGKRDLRRTFRHKAWQSRTKPTDDVTVLDLTRDPED